VRIESSRHQHGLGISGLRSKDGNGPFTGLGLFSVRPSPWRNTPLSGDSQHDHRDKAALSNSHRSELCDATAGAVQAQTQSFPKYDSESSDMFHNMTGTPNHQSQRFLSGSYLSHRTLTPPQLVKHFSAPPVLNDLKEMSPQLNEHCRRRLGRSAYISRRAVPSVLWCLGRIFGSPCLLSAIVRIPPPESPAAYYIIDCRIIGFPLPLDFHNFHGLTTQPRVPVKWYQTFSLCRNRSSGHSYLGAVLAFWDAAARLGSWVPQTDVALASLPRYLPG